MTDDMNMHAKLTIVFPVLAGLPILAMDHTTGQRGIVTKNKAQEVICGALFRDDMVTRSLDFPAKEGIAIIIFDREEVDRIKKLYAEKGLLP